jgi:membrane protease YdiL (CAAX protease family)
MKRPTLLATLLLPAFLLALPAFAAQAESLYAWTTAVPPAVVVALLPFIVLGEEIVWRNAVTLPLAARLGPWPGVLAAAAAFAAAHLPMGVPLLLIAAFAAGAFWSALVVKTGSAVPSLVSHLLWDVAVMFLLPYPRA